MPRIPLESYYPGVDAGAAQPFHFDTGAFNPGLAAAAGNQEQAAGNALMNLGSEATNIATDFQSHINDTAVSGARIKLAQYRSVLADDPQSGYLAQMGEAAYKPVHGTGEQTTTDVALDSYSKYRDEVMAGLDNDRQRQMLTPHADEMAVQIQQESQKHALGQFKQVASDTQDGLYTTAIDNGKRLWNDSTGQRDKELLNAQTAFVKSAQLQGKPPEWIAANLRKASGSFHTGVLEEAMKNGDVSFASAYFQQHKDAKRDDNGNLTDAGMTADGILKFTAEMVPVINAKISQQAVGEAVKNFQSNFAPAPMDRLRSIVYGMESSNNPNAVGPNVPGQGTAKGINQVMDATAANPGFGIAPAKTLSDGTIDPKDRQRVGDQYLDALVSKYGNPAQALAAYNAGPGRVDAAIKDKGAAWLTSLPDETQKYVQAGVSKLNSGQGAPQIPSEQDFVSFAMARLGSDPRPELIKSTREAAEHQYTIISKSNKEQGAVAVNNVYRDLAANGWDMNSVDPALRSEVLRLAPDKWDDITKTARTNFKGENVTNMAEFNHAYQHPEFLAQMSDAQFNNYQRENFSQSDGKTILKLRDDALNGSDGSGNFNSKAVNQFVDNRIVSLGVKLPSKSDPVEQQAWVGSMRKFAQDQVMAQQAQLGRKMNQNEVEQTIDGLFAKNVNFQTQYFGGLMSTQQSQNLMTLKVDDIPQASMDSIKQSFARAKVSNPTNDQILRAYWATKVGKNG